MITAYDAYNKSATIQNKKHADQLGKCEESIRKAIDIGNTSCYVYETLTDVVKKELQKLGYKLSEYSDQRDGSTTTITWTHAICQPDDCDWRR